MAQTSNHTYFVQEFLRSTMSRLAARVSPRLAYRILVAASDEVAMPTAAAHNSISCACELCSTYLSKLGWAWLVIFRIAPKNGFCLVAETPLPRVGFWRQIIAG